MSDKPREWPNVARENRDRAAEAAVVIIRSLEPLVTGGNFTETERLRREATALNSAQTIARLLEAVGAQTRA